MLVTTTQLYSHYCRGALIVNTLLGVTIIRRALYNEWWQLVLASVGREHWPMVQRRLTIRSALGPSSNCYSHQQNVPRNTSALIDFFPTTLLLSSPFRMS